MNARSEWHTVRWLVWRDVTLAWRRRADLFGTLCFFVLVVTLVTLGVGPDTALLRVVGPGVVWVALLLSAMLSLGRLFADDFADGTLDQMLLAPCHPALVVAGKVVAQWLVAVLPLLVVSPICALQLGLGAGASLLLLGALLLGAPVVLLAGAIGAALTLGVRGAGALTPVIVLPLCVPTLVFGTGAVLADANVAGHFKLLAALLLLAVTFAPLAAAAALRMAVE